MTQTNQQPSVTRFEQAVHAQDYETACTELLTILGSIDGAFGGFSQIECTYPQQIADMEQECAVHLCNRLAVAITKLFDVGSQWGFSDSGFERCMNFHRWISIIFASSSYINADHILQTYFLPNEEQPELISLPNDLNTWRRFCLLFTMESNIPLDFDMLWQVNQKLCASLCFALQSPRFIGTKSAFDKRNLILQWFPSKLAQIETLEGLPANISHDVYMHCSYDIHADKHRVKQSLNQVIRRHMNQLGVNDRTDLDDIATVDGKPVMFVVLEHFHSAHSIYRTHSTSLIAARERFHIVGFGGSAVDEAGRAVFDEFVQLDADTILDKIAIIRQHADSRRPAILYMPSIGMDLTPIFLSNLRFAPIQAVALGHPATTHSPYIDHVVVEDDYVGSPDCFSEELIRLPKDALPYVPSALAPTSVEYRLRENPEVVQIGVAATTMKLNPYFLMACQAILERSQVPVHFHFALGQSAGITHPYVVRFIKQYLGEHATAHQHKPYHEYLQVLDQCDMMINPFPFGNTNGIIDMVTLGLVGVCKTGDEVHEHIDEGLFGRLGLPKDLLVADTVNDYVAKAVALAQDHQLRLQLRRHIIENNGLATLFTGDASAMGKAFLDKLTERGLYQHPKPKARRTSKPKATKTDASPKPKRATKAKSDTTDKPKRTSKPKATKA